MSLALEKLTGEIIGAAIEVHRELWPGFIESIYENALVIELEARGLRVERQQKVVILYRGQEVGRHRFDLLVESLVIVELKTTRNLEDVHFAFARSYLKALNLKHGLLL